MPGVTRRADRPSKLVETKRGMILGSCLSFVVTLVVTGGGTRHRPRYLHHCQRACRLRPTRVVPSERAANSCHDRRRDPPNAAPNGAPGDTRRSPLPTAAPLD